MTEIQGVAEIEEAAARLTWLPGEVAGLLSDRFFDAETCADWFLARCYPDGPACPRCGGAITGERALARWRRMQRLTCPHCQRKVKASTGTLLQESHLDPRGLFVLLSLLGLGVDPSDVAQVLGVTAATVLTWRDKVIALAEVPV
jgi:transposase-like protein